MSNMNILKITFTMKEYVCENHRNYTSKLVTRGKNKKGVLNRIILYFRVLETR